MRIVGRTKPVGAVKTVTEWLQTVAASKLRNTALGAEARQIARSADNNVIPLVYGEDRVGALILNVWPYQGTLVVQCLWAHQGDSVNDIKLNSKDLPPGSTFTNYDGSQGSADSTLSAAATANGYSYSETLAGYMYSVIRVPLSSVGGTLDFSARIKGRKVLDTRTSTTAWSDCPALCLRDFLTNTTYGCGKTVVASTVNTVANLNDALVSGSEKRRIVGVTFRNLTLLEDIAETLRTYAGCFLSPTASGIELIGDTTRSTDATYSHSGGQIARIVSLTKKEQGNVPTVVEVIYTNASTFPWRDAYAVVEASGVSGGTVPRRVSQVPLPGIRRHSQATREATERLNKLRTSDLHIVLEVFDSGIAHQEGDVIEVTHPIGLDAKKFRIIAPEYAGPGLWKITGDEYDPAAYSDSLASGPTYPDTNFLFPGAPERYNHLKNADWTEELGYGATGQADARALRYWTGYGFGTSTHPRYFGRNYGNGAIWNLGRGGSWLNLASGTAAVTSSNGLYLIQVVPCQPGLYYEGQVLGAIWRCEGWMYLRFWDSTLNYFSDAQGAADSVTVGNSGTGQYYTLEDRPMLWRFGKAPVTADGTGTWSDGTARDAAYMGLVFGLSGNGTGTDPYIFWQRAGIFGHGTSSGLTKAGATKWTDSLPSSASGQVYVQETSCTVTDYCNWQTQVGAHTYKYHQSGSWSLSIAVTLAVGDKIVIECEGYIMTAAATAGWLGIVTDILVSGSGKTMFHTDATDRTDNLFTFDGNYRSWSGSSDKVYANCSREYTASSAQTVTVGIIFGMESSSKAGTTYAKLRVSRVLK